MAGRLQRCEMVLVSMYIPVRLLAEIDSLAKEGEVTRSELVRQCLRRAVAERRAAASMVPA
jgi:metal-responsive CopG/Arc/MetJ family transcriptional regulator